MKEFWTYLPFYIDPVAFSLGPFDIRWYSIMYVGAILTTFGAFIYHIKKTNDRALFPLIPDLLLSAIIGIILGARLGYALFYQPLYYLTHPIVLFWPMDGGTFVGIQGLSYHGGAIGLLVALYFLTKRYKVSFSHFMNKLVVYIPLGYTLGRIGNFLNLELYGRVTQSPLGMIFPTDPNRLIRYPSQLIEAFSEGILLFIILLWCRKNSILKKILTPIYCIGYGTVRFFVEFVREPDPFQTLWFGILSYGQVLSLLMIILGIILIPFFNRHETV